MVPSNAVQQQGVGAISADQANSYVQTVDTAPLLRSFVGVSGMEIALKGLATPNDGGQGLFYWSATSPGPDDGNNVIVPTGVTVGAWVRLGAAPTPTTNAQVFRASVQNAPVNPYAGTSVLKVPYDTIDFDTTGGFSLTQAVPVYGTIPAFKVPATGYWLFTAVTQFFDSTNSDGVSILQAISQITNTGADHEFYQFNSPFMQVNNSFSSQTFSVGFSVTAFCTAGYFVFVNSNLESSLSSATLQINNGLSTLACTYFSGQLIR